MLFQSFGLERPTMRDRSGVVPRLSWTLSNLEMTAGEVKLKTIFVQRGLREYVLILVEN